jgi:hypothetical protein
MSHARTIDFRVYVLAAAAALSMILAFPAPAQTQTAEPDGLVRVQSQHFDAAFLAPGADFRSYTKVMLDPTEADFARNWQRDYNNTQRDLGARISDDDAREILQTAQTAFHDVLTQAYRTGGYEIVTTPGPDVLRIRTGLANIRISAPDTMSAGRSATFSSEAGQAVLVLEARDSMSGAVLGRAYDRRRIDDNTFMSYRNRVTNRADFERAFRRWADASVQALNNLRATPAPAAATAGG